MTHKIHRLALTTAAVGSLALSLGGAAAAHAPALPASFETSVGAQDYRLTAIDSAPPSELTPAIHEHLSDRGVTVSAADGEALMDIWFARQLPTPETPPVDPAVAYGTLNEGVVLAVMRLHHEHRDFRDQSVPAGTYVARYLRQPDDGNHLGETTYRDFAVLVSATARSAAPQRFDVTLGQALQLNIHPFVWGLWPADYVPAAEQPGIASFEPDKWAVKLSLPRADGSTLALALVVVGNDRHYD